MSADADNPTNTCVRFSHLNAQYGGIFATFSPEKLFAPIGTTLMGIRFFVPGTNTPATVKGFGAVFIDVDRSGATRLEFDLFAQLCRRPHEVCTRAQLIAAVWDPGWVGDTHVVDVHLSNLRRKLNQAHPNTEFIRTVRGVGFRISDDLLSVAASELAELHPLVLPA